MTSSDSESESESDTLVADEPFSITKGLLMKPIYAEDTSCESSSFEASSKLTNKLIQTTTTYVPLIVQNMISRKRPHGGSTVGRRYIPRDRINRHELILKDYFIEGSKYPPEMFRRRFRMDRDLFNRILVAIQGYDSYFTQKVDASRRLGLSPLQKMIASLRILAYGVPADFIDEYIQIGQSTSLESLIHFCDAVIGVFEGRYLRKPNDDDIKRLLKENEARGFPGMIGSLDCMHWHWSNCPKAWHGMYTNGFKKVPTLILEVVASKDLWIWHAFFGMAGTNNDITVLDRSPLFDDIINGVAPQCQFEVEGHRYDIGYYLSDGIYPPYAALMQTKSEPSNPKEKLFAKQQESVRKDVERAFGVLQKRWHIIKGSARMWKVSHLGKIMKTCIILHNMIIESEHHQGLDPERWEPLTPENVQNVNLEHNSHFLLDVMIT